MKGSINGIYFTNTGTFPAHIISNLKKIAKETQESDYVVKFWTDVSVLKDYVRDELQSAGVIIGDYRDASMPLNEMVKSFVDKGHAGDVCAYAIASDILRVALIDSLSSDEIYIYADCNDVKFLNLSIDLCTLEARFDRNSFGLSFPINILEKNPNGKITVVEHRNDCMIVRKRNNPSFIERFLERYTTNVLARGPVYVATNDNRLKKAQADSISSFVSSIPFETLTIGYVRMAKECEIAAIEDIDFSTYFTTIRQLEYANSWRGFEEERADLAENHCISNFHRMDEDIIQLLARYEVWMRNLAIIDNVVQRFNALELKKFIEVVTPNSPFSYAYTASAPGEPGDPGSGGSVTCFEDDEAALPQKEIIKQGNVHFFRDIPPSEKSTLAIKSIEKKELVSYGNIHFFKDIILREEPPRVSVVLKPRNGL